MKSTEISGLLILTILLPASPAYAYDNDTVKGIGMVALFIAIIYIPLYLIAQKLWQFYKKRKASDLPPMSTGKKIGLAIGLLLSYECISILGRIFAPASEVIGGFVQLTMIIAIFGGLAHYFLRGLWTLNRDPRTDEQKAHNVSDGDHRTKVGMARKIFKPLGMLAGIAAIILVIWVATFSPSGYRVKGYNAMAKADLRNTKVCVEAYIDKERQVPETLEKSGCPPVSDYVDLTYTRTGPDKYQMNAWHKNYAAFKESREYMTTSRDPIVYWRIKGEPAGQWEKM